MRYLFCVILFFLLFVSGCESISVDVRIISDQESPISYMPQGGNYYYGISSYEDVNRFFSLDSTDIIVSAHRGGSFEYFPENSIETMDTVLHYMTSFFEIDPRYTKDRVPVLMHDATIDRTTNGTGSLSSFTLEEVRSFRLKDRYGHLTECMVPTLEEVIVWSIGKVILNFDQKNVSYQDVLALVNKYNAVNCIYTVHSVSEAKAILKICPEMRLSAFLGTMEKYNEYNSAGLLDHHVVIAYVESSMLDVDKEVLYKAIRGKNIRIMVSTAPDQDNQLERKKRISLYSNLVNTHPDIIESDYPLEFIGLPGIRQ